jgi:hypothetical protein
VDIVAPKRQVTMDSVEQVILLVSDKPIECRAMVVIKPLFIGLERI